MNIRITLLSAGIRKMKMKAKWLPIAAAVTAALASHMYRTLRKHFI